MSEHFGHAPGFVLVNISSKQNVSVAEGQGVEKNVLEIFENPYIDKEIRAGLILGKHLLETKDFDALLTTSMGEISFQFFREHIKDVFLIPKDITAKVAIQKMQQEKLEQLKSPTHCKEELD